MLSTITPASVKKQVLAAVRAVSLRTVTEEVQACIALDVESANAVPFQLAETIYQHWLFDGKCDMPALSAWLRAAGYCLCIEYRDTGNNDIIEKLTVDYYENRGHERIEAIETREIHATGKTHYA